MKETMTAVGPKTASETEVSACRQEENLQSFVQRNSHRGVGNVAAAELVTLNRRILSARMDYPLTYGYSDLLDSAKGSRYRTGYAEGCAYLTVDDFKKLYLGDKTRMAFDALKKQGREAQTAVQPANLARPAYPYVAAHTAAPGLFSRRTPVFGANGEAEARIVPEDKASLHRIRGIGEKYLGSVKTVKAGSCFRHTSGAIAALASVLVFALLLALPIVMRINIHEKTASISALDAEIAAKEKTVAQLELELDIRNKRENLEAIAKDEYHMVKLDDSNFTVLRTNLNDTIETAEKKKSGGAVPALLNALGLRIKE